MQAQASQERDDEDVYFDDESAEVVINSLRLGEEPDSGSLFTNSNWFAFDEDKALNDGPEASLSANLESPSLNVDDDDMDEVILGDPTDGTKGSDSLLATSDRDLNEVSGQTVLLNGPVDKLENDIRPSTPDVKESPAECVEWTEEDAEPGEVSENTAVLSSEVESEKVMDATDGVMPSTGQVGEEQGSENLVESSAPDTTIEKTLPHSPDVNSTGDSEPADGSANLESPLGEQKQEKEEIQEK